MAYHSAMRITPSARGDTNFTPRLKRDVSQTVLKTDSIRRRRRGRPTSDSWNILWSRIFFNLEFSTLSRWRNHQGGLTRLSSGRSTSPFTLVFQRTYGCTGRGKPVRLPMSMALLGWAPAVFRLGLLTHVVRTYVSFRRTNSNLHLGPHMYPPC